MSLREQINFHAAKLRRLRKQARKEAAERLGHVKRRGIGSRDRDEDLKARRGYTDPSTYVRRDGSEKLVGEDWIKRKQELWHRARNTCEMFRVLKKDHVADCHFSTRLDAHHIVKRSTRRDDRLQNLALLSAVCHDSLDPRKPRWTKQGVGA